MSFLKEFREFAVKGNVMDLAVGVIIGAAFGKIVSSLVADVSPIFKAHLFLGMTLFLVFPFTRLVHVWSAPVWYLGRNGYQIVRSRRDRADLARQPESRIKIVQARWSSGSSQPLPAE